MTKKIKHFDLTFECKGGRYKLSEAKEIPTIKEINDLLPTFDGVGLGAIKSIIIDNIKV